MQRCVKQTKSGSYQLVDIILLRKVSEMREICSSSAINMWRKSFDLTTKLSKLMENVKIFVVSKFLAENEKRNNK